MKGQALERVLQGKQSNHLLPFFWQHGEDEATLRKYMTVISDSDCGAVCVESRPHEDFCGPGWWRDMDIILDEARKRGMQVWILDDKHFPTGYVVGAMETAPAELCRQSVYSASWEYEGEAREIHIPASELHALPEPQRSQIQMGMEHFNPPNHRKYDDDRILSVCALNTNDGEILDLADFVKDGELLWQKPEGRFRVYSCGLSRNFGPHRNYINMMDQASCRVLIDAVYEPHYARYKEHFGKTIAGFFSDEPELGNGALYAMGNTLGTPQDLPWSRELEATLIERLGAGWEKLLPLLWDNDADAKQTANVRYAYMDCVTKLVQSDFSQQLGDWCRAHGVMYIGHVVEDNNQHARTASSLGHYFRGLAGQDMAGIDDVSGQVLPGCEDEPTSSMGGMMPRDGEFYHYMLGKLGSSHAAIDPMKKGRAMCEIFGNYGWSEGVQLEKYLVDHFLVRGINNLVPHAFSPKAYPDSDCPPHFYAHGHNPQYRHFGQLMRYTNRVCELISGGASVPQVALFYHGEAEWCGGEYMFTQKPARRLMDSQIDFDIIPADVFAEPARYNTSVGSGLSVNTQRYKAFVLPMADYIPAEVAKAAAKLHASGFPVVFIEKLPIGVCDGDDALLDGIASCTVVKLDELVEYLEALHIPEIRISPANNRVRALHYRNPQDVYMFVNEGNDVYKGEIRVPTKGPCFLYNAWENRLEAAQAVDADEGTVLTVEVIPRHSLIVVFDEAEEFYQPRSFGAAAHPLGTWRRSLCASVDYPNFGEEKSIDLPENLAAEQPEFSGYVRYETTFELPEVMPVKLCITDAAEGVEVFVNGKSAGIQIVPTYVYDITDFVQTGANSLAIEVATTLERERAANPINEMERMMPVTPTSESGITGSVYLQY